MKPFYCIVFFFLSWVVCAQNVKVLNKITQEPIFGVAIYNIDKSKSQVTNFRGDASLSEFQDNEVIYFKHLLTIFFSFGTISVTYV